MAPATDLAGIRKDRSAARSGLAAILLLICQPLLFFWRVLINPVAHIPFDLPVFHLPLISFQAQSWRTGVAPLWDPYFYGGVPLHADSQAQMFYPFTWLVILAGNHSQGHNLLYWVQALVPLHMILGGLFAFWLLCRMGLCIPAAFLGASVYQLGGFFASQAQHLGAMCSAAWFPLAILAVFEMRRRIRVLWIAVLALAVALSILAGFVANTLVIGVAVLLMMAALLALQEASFRLIPAVAAGFLIAALISTVELIPLWQLTQASIASLRANWFFRGGGLPLQSLVSLIIPNYYHIFEPDTLDKLPSDYTFLYVYCGIATAALLGLAPIFGKARERVFLTLTMVCAIWMLGEHTPIYPALHVHFPGFLRGAMYSEEALMAFCFFGAITASLLLDRFGKRLPVAALWAIALWSSYDLIHTGANRPMNSYEGGYKEQTSEYRITRTTDLLERLRKLVNETTPPSRIDYTDTTALADVMVGSDMLGLPTANGDNPFMLRRMLYLRRLFSGGQWWERKLPVDRPGSPLVSMLNITWLVGGSRLAAEQVRLAGLEEREVSDGVWGYRNPRALPRFFLVSRIRRSPSESETFRLLGQYGFNPAEEAIVEDVPSDRSGLTTAPVSVKAYTPNRIQLSVATSGPAYLATSEPMYAGWEARVNGKRQPLLMTNGAFRGLALPAGASEIAMEYHPPHLGFYLFFSGIMAFLTLGMILRGAAAQRPSFEWVKLAPRKQLRRPYWISAALDAMRKRRLTLGWLSLLVPVTILFYWKILLTDQFSLLTMSEAANQSYSWLRFWIVSVRHGVVPLWDPYTFAGHSFAGEMQTAAFYPLHLVLALFPLTRNSVLSPYLYHAWWAGAHLLGACFLFLLAREFGLSRFASFVAGICFSLGGFVARMGWPHMLESSIWLPLIVLAFLRALRAGDIRRLVRNASLGGMALGMSILAGGFHVVILQAIVVLSAAVFYGWNRGARKAAFAAAVITTVGCAVGAVQLLPSIEYSGQAIRFLGSSGTLPANEKIPYYGMHDALSPHGIFTLLIPEAFDGKPGTGEVPNPYLGVFPLLAVIIGIRRNWSCPWVRYLAGLAVAAFLYSFGPFSWLHGVLYATVPKLWMAREAPRILYLADFSLALLTGYGIDTLLSRGADASWKSLNRVLLAVVIACAILLFVPAVLGKPEISRWISLSMVLIFASYGLFWYILRGNSGTSAKVFIVALILFDLSAFDWTAYNILEVRKTGVDHLGRNLSLEGAANFLKSNGGPFRVQVVAVPEPNLGDLFGIETIGGAGVTLPAEYPLIGGRGDLLNVRYVVKPASTADPNPLYQDAAWKVYGYPGFPRSWVVHEAIVQRPEAPTPAYQPSRTALVYTSVQGPLQPASNPNVENTKLSAFSANHAEFKVHTQTPGLLVMSETYYPGWRATVNDVAQQVYRVDGDLRGVSVPAGNSKVVLEYKPWSVYAGAILSFLALLGTAYFYVRW
jgi:hypothetical protein